MLKTRIESALCALSTGICKVTVEGDGWERQGGGRGYGNNIEGADTPSNLKRVDGVLLVGCILEMGMEMEDTVEERGSGCKDAVF